MEFHENMKVPGIDGERANGSVLLEFMSGNSRIGGLCGLPRGWDVRLGSY